MHACMHIVASVAEFCSFVYDKGEPDMSHLPRSGSHERADCCCKAEVSHWSTPLASWL